MSEADCERKSILLDIWGLHSWSLGGWEIEIMKLCHLICYTHCQAIIFIFSSSLLGFEP